MKYLVQNWRRDDDSILYFFHRLEEMLFHYSKDIVRVPIHNSRTLINEYLYNESEKNAERVKDYQLEQIINELKVSLQNDNIMRENLGHDFIVGVVSELSVQKGEVIRYINNKLPGQTYLNWCIDYLIKHSKFPTHKEEVEEGLKGWIVEIISSGFVPEYIYNYLQKYLAQKHPDANLAFKNFLEHFKIQTNKYRVYLTFTNEMMQCKNILNKRLKICFEDDGNFLRIRKRKNDFIGYIEVESFDEYGAIYKAYSHISIFLKYYQVVSNRKRELIRKNGCVKSIKDNLLSFIPFKSIGYRSIEISPDIDITSSVDHLIINCQAKSQKTRYQLDKIIELHNEAILQPDLNDGFLNLWSILEVISTDSVGCSKIEKVIHSIIPTLKKDYLHAVLDNIESDLEDNLSPLEYSNLVETVSAKYGNLNPIGCFIFLQEFEQLREEYFLKLEKYPNIRNKIYRLYILRDDVSKVISLSDKYEQKVKWHIYRLYRTRNAIVHSGESPKNIQRLGEHLHIYVDRLIYEILVKLSQETTLGSISDILIDTKLLLDKVKIKLNKNSPVSEGDILWMYESYNYITNETIS